jgi:hypothetical protein
VVGDTLLGQRTLTPPPIKLGSEHEWHVDEAPPQGHQSASASKIPKRKTMILVCMATALPHEKFAILKHNAPIESTNIRPILKYSIRQTCNLKCRIISRFPISSVDITQQAVARKPDFLDSQSGNFHSRTLIFNTFTHPGPKGDSAPKIAFLTYRILRDPRQTRGHNWRNRFRKPVRAGSGPVFVRSTTVKVVPFWDRC